MDEVEEPAEENFYKIQSLDADKERSIYGYHQLMSFFPGIVNSKLQYGFYELIIDSLREDDAICFGVIISNTHTNIGKGVYIGTYCRPPLYILDDDLLWGRGSNHKWCSSARNLGFNDS